MNYRTRLDNKKVGNGKRILIVEDEPELLYSIEFSLRRLGYLVSPASEAETALLFFDSDSTVTNPFNLIITDIQLPGISGLEFIDSLRAIAVQTPLLVITAYRGIDIVESLKSRNIQYILIKPFGTQQLLEQVALAIK